MSVISFGEFSGTRTWDISSAPSSLSSGIPVTPVLHLLQFFHIVLLCVLFSLFFLFIFQCREFLLTYLQVHWVFPWSPQPANEPILVPFISSISFQFFLRVSISLLPLPISSCVLSYTVFIKVTNVLTIVGSDSLCNPDVCTTAESDLVLCSSLQSASPSAFLHDLSSFADSGTLRLGSKNCGDIT